MNTERLGNAAIHVFWPVFFLFASVLERYFTRHAAYEQGVPLDWPVQYDLARTVTPHRNK